MWEAILVGADGGKFFRTLVAAPLLYMVVVGFIRVSGKRSTSQMNNFDWIVTVAMGSLVASGIISENVGVLESMFAIALLLLAQYLLTWSVIRSDALATVVKASPRLLLFRGEILPDALRAERISRRELLSAIRDEGLPNLDDVTAVVLETDGTFSVIANINSDETMSMLQDVRGFDHNNH